MSSFDEANAEQVVEEHKVAPGAQSALYEGRFA